MDQDVLLSVRGGEEGRELPEIVDSELRADDIW